MPKTIKRKGNPMHGLLLGVSAVFDNNEEKTYLTFRQSIWNLPSPTEPRLQELPLICKPEKLPTIEDPERRQELNERKRCISSALDYYFPLFEGEEVREEVHSYLIEQFGPCPPGTAAVVRTTNMAVMYAVVSGWQVDLAALRLKQVPVPLALESPVPSSLKGGEAQLLADILISWADLLTGPAGALVKTGIALLSYALGKAGEQGPSWEDMKKMIREVVREELITNDLEHVHAAYQSLQHWSDIEYLPRKRTRRVTHEELWRMLEPKAHEIDKKLSLLIEPNHRLPGFALLLFGVSMYLSILQEQRALGYANDITKAAERWASEMLKVWEEVKADRHRRITVKRYAYERWTGWSYTTYYYWAWKDEKTGVTKPFPDEEKDNTHEDECRRDADRYFKEEVLPLTSKQFGNPEAMAEKWRDVNPNPAKPDEAIPVRRYRAERGGKTYDYYGIQPPANPGWVPDRVAFFAFENSREGLKPIYRFSKEDEEHGRVYCLRSEQQATEEWRREEIAFYAYAERTEDSEGVSEFSEPSKGGELQPPKPTWQHWYTTRANDVDYQKWRPTGRVFWTPKKILTEE